jgi:hypothetical protein
MLLECVVTLLTTIKHFGKLYAPLNGAWLQVGATLRR